MLFARKKPHASIIDQSKNATSRCSNPSPTSDDTSFVLSIGHLAWNGNKFVANKPSRLPACEVHVRLLRDEHNRYLGNDKIF